MVGIRNIQSLQNKKKSWDALSLSIISKLKNTEIEGTKPIIKIATIDLVLESIIVANVNLIKNILPTECEFTSY